MNYQIRPVVPKDFQVAFKWAAEEGWNPGLYDADSFFATDPDGFFIGFLDEEPIASISAVRYDDRFCFLGLYIVKPKHRNKGYGLKIWDETLKYLSAQTIGLDGVVAQQDNYKKSGFRLAYRNVRFEGKGLKLSENHPELILLKNIPFNLIKEYDDQVFPTSRPSFLRSWIQQPESLAVGFLKNKRLLGYGVVRKCQKGYKIGPLFADTKNIAEILFLRMCEYVGPDNLIYLDIPELNKNALALAKKYNLKPMFETARMYKGKEPEVPLHKIYGVTALELG
ncbi:GNAT family N-acetyltransferase [Candidatus Microgenomates bacterium]|nr:GNAT family N-acetyltransferase [Candidatus Microgenomates bacterium]